MPALLLSFAFTFILAFAPPPRAATTLGTGGRTARRTGSCVPEAGRGRAPVALHYVAPGCIYTLTPTIPPFLRTRRTPKGEMGKGEGEEIAAGVREGGGGSGRGGGDDISNTLNDRIHRQLGQAMRASHVTPGSRGNFSFLFFFLLLFLCAEKVTTTSILRDLHNSYSPFVKDHDLRHRQQTNTRHTVNTIQ